MRAGAKESQVGSCRVRFTDRQHVLVVELLSPLTTADLSSLSRAIANQARTMQTQRTLLDVRAHGAPDRGFRDALTEWAVAEEAPLVLVVGDELHVAEVNMASLGAGGRVRAFASAADAFRHAVRTSGRSPSDETTRPSLDPDERRAMLFPRRPSEVIRVRRESEPSSTEVPRARADGSTTGEQLRARTDSEPPRARRDSELPRARRDSELPRARRDSDLDPLRPRRDSDLDPLRPRRDSDLDPLRPRRDSDRSGVALPQVTRTQEPEPRPRRDATEIARVRRESQTQLPRLRRTSESGSDD